jgi:hypothetical protein
VARRIAEEFWQQGDLEKRVLAAPSNQLMDRLLIIIIILTIVIIIIRIVIILIPSPSSPASLSL